MKWGIFFLMIGGVLLAKPPEETDFSEDKEWIIQNLYNLDNDYVLQTIALDSLNRNEKKLDLDLFIEKLRASLKSEQIREKILAPLSCLSEQTLRDIRGIFENPAYQELIKKNQEISNAQIEIIQQKADEILNELGENSDTNIIELTSENFCSQILLSTRPMIIDCSSKNCIPCHQLNPIFDALHAKYGEKIQFAKIDCTAQPELAKLFRIRSVPTLLFMKPDRRFPIIVKETIGKPTAEELETTLLQLISE